MLSVGIDVAKRSHQACILDDLGQMVGQSFKFSSSRGGVDLLVSTLQELGSPATIAMEASGHYWQGLYHYLTSQGFPVLVVNPLQTEAYRSTGVRKVKNDPEHGRTAACRTAQADPYRGTVGIQNY